jgi:membrane protein
VTSSYLHAMRPARQTRPSSSTRPSHFKNAFVLFKTLLADLERSRTPGLAAELAFWLFLSLIPLAAVAGMVAAKIAVGNTDLSYQLLGPLPDEVRELVARQLGEVAAWNGGAVGVKAALVFLWLASSGMHAIFDLIELKTEARRPWWKKRLLALGTCIVLSIGVALLALLATGLSWVGDLVSGALPREGFLPGASWVNKLLRFGIGVATGVALVAGIFWIGFPPTARTKIPILPGALLAVGLEVVLALAYAFYISKMGTGSAYSASLAVIGVTLLSLYLFSLALLIGAQFNYTLCVYREKRA